MLYKLLKINAYMESWKAQTTRTSILNIWRGKQKTHQLIMKNFSIESVPQLNHYRNGQEQKVKFWLQFLLYHYCSKAPFPSVLEDIHRCSVGKGVPTAPVAEYNS